MLNLKINFRCWKYITCRLLRREIMIAQEVQPLSKGDYSKKKHGCFCFDTDPPLTSINVKMTATTTSSFCGNSSKPFPRPSVSACLIIPSPSWSLENGWEKFQKLYWKHHQEEHCMHQQVFSQIDINSCLAQKSQSLTCC